MSRIRRHWARGLALSAAAAAAFVVAGGASGETIQAGNLILKIDGSFSPHALPKKVPGPLKLSVSGSIATADGSHVPALKTLLLEFDKHGGIYTKGLPTCSINQLTNTITSQAKKVCGDALVGEGTTTAEVQFPDAQPFTAKGPLLIFNGKPQGGNPVLIQHVYAHVPTPTTFVVPAVIGREHGGKYGNTTFVKIPPIAGGFGSLTSFDATIDKTWTYQGRKRSLLTAACPTGELFAHGDFTFVDGTELSGSVVKPCAAKGR